MRMLMCVTMLLMTASASAQLLYPPATVTNIETRGNLATKKPLKCSAGSMIRNTDTPPDIYAGMVDCAQHGRYTDAVHFFAIAGVFSYFDAQRVADKTAEQAHSVLTRDALGQLDDETRTAVGNEIKAVLGDDAKRDAVCAEVEHIGMPNYHPDYMIQHGMDAVQGHIQGDGLVPGFDADNAWKSALKSYLHCAKF